MVHSENPEWSLGQIDLDNPKADKIAALKAKKTPAGKKAAAAKKTAAIKKAKGKKWIGCAYLDEPASKDDSKVGTASKKKLPAAPQKKRSKSAGSAPSKKKWS